MLSQRVPFATLLGHELLAEAGWLVVSGYLLLEPDAGISGAGESPRRILLGCSLGSTEVSGWLDAAADLRPHLAIVNADEAGAISGFDAEPSTLARRVAERLGAIAVVTHPGGAAASLDGVSVEIAATSAEPAVDATGAGDAFSAGLIADLAYAPWPPDAGQLEHAMASGAELASAVARVPGAQGRVAARAAVMTPTFLAVADEVRDAIDAGRGVVALESSLIAQGLPVPDNLETALAAEAAVREAGAVPATVAVEDGRIVVGADRALLERLADPGRAVAKAGSRDLGPLLAARVLASTTVSATMRAAHLAGIAMFATGGIGGVHRGAASTFDVSSDIDELAATPVAVVCSGAKSILDLPATLELLETRRVPVVGYGTDELPAFYSTTSGLRLAHRVDGPAAAAAAIAAHRSIPGAGGILVVQPPPADLAIDRDEVDGWIREAIADAESRSIHGGAVTPHLLGHLARASGGRTLRVNIGLIVANARTAGAIASALT